MDPRLPKMSKNGMGTIRPQRPSTAYRIRCVTCFLERRATSWALMMVQIYNKKRKEQNCSLRGRYGEHRIPR